MRYFEKRPAEHLLIFNQWKEENRDKIQAWIDNNDKTGDNLWTELGKTFGAETETNIDPKTVRNALETALFEEQHGLCCYCGNLIQRLRHEELDPWEYFHRAIEHFEAKNKFKDKTFDYENLFLCCKESQRLTTYEVGKTIKSILIQGFEQVATLANMPQSVIKEFPKNKKNTEGVLNLKKGDKIYVPNPPHCDDEKSKFDSRENHLVIINPSKDKALIDLLHFEENGQINYTNSDTLNNEIIDNTITVLALNGDTLVERRKDKWADVWVQFYDVELPNWIENITEIGIEDESETNNIIKNNVNKLIEGKAKPNEEGLLEPFYFVEVDFLKTLFNAQI